MSVDPPAMSVDPWAMSVDPRPLRGQWAVIAGASKGIGLGIAARMLAAGANLVLVARDGVALEQAVDGARRHAVEGQQVVGRTCDLADRDAIDELFEWTATELPVLDHYVANAGTGFVKDLVDLTRDDWDGVVDLNFNGTMWGVRRAARLMIERPSLDGVARANRAIVVVSSIRALGARPGRLVYAATKAAVNQAVRCAAMELAPHGIRINALSPGITETPLTARNPAAFAEAVANVPLGRAAVPADLGEAGCFLCSPASAFITGANLVVDGGESLH